MLVRGLLKFLSLALKNYRDCILAGILSLIKCNPCSYFYSLYSILFSFLLVQRIEAMTELAGLRQNSLTHT
jgi:hypothetical protein